jgi:hypothetical protein
MHQRRAEALRIIIIVCGACNIFIENTFYYFLTDAYIEISDFYKKKHEGSFRFAYKQKWALH